METTGIEIDERYITCIRDNIRVSEVKFSEAAQDLLALSLQSQVGEGVVETPDEAIRKAAELFSVFSQLEDIRNVEVVSFNMALHLLVGLNDEYHVFTSERWPFKPTLK